MSDFFQFVSTRMSGCSQSQHGRSAVPRLSVRHEVLHSLQEAVIVVGIDELIELYNETAFQLWGWPEDKVIGAHYSLLLGRDVDISPHSKSQQRVLTKHEVSYTGPERTVVFPLFNAYLINQFKRRFIPDHGTMLATFFSGLY